MNVAFDPWIPVVNIAGELKLASLIEVLTEGDKFSDLAVRPHERVSLMRLFICVAHASLNGPKDYDEWCDVPDRLPDAVQKYLKDRNEKESFELFHPKKPWLQVAELKAISNKNNKHTSPVALLDFELATGNRSTFFDHEGLAVSRFIKPERTALNLLTFQNFSPSGGSPIAQWKKVKTSQVGNPDSPCLSQSMAHCLLRGSSLIETLHLNLPTFENVAKGYQAFSINKESITLSEVSLGKPVWHFFPNSPEKNSKQAINATKTYIGRLVPISRWIRLIDNSDQMYCCNGFKYDTFRDGFAPEPTAAVHVVSKRNKKGIESKEREVVKINPGRALWRELSALLIKRTAFGIGGPLAVENAPNETGFDFQVCAITRDQASMDIALESVFHISPSFRNNLTIYHAEVAGSKNVLGAEGYARKLGGAIEVYRQKIDGDWEKRLERNKKNQWLLKEKLYSRATTHYWTTVETNLSLLMAHIEAIGTDKAMPTRKAWRNMLFATASEAYKITCGHETPRQMRAFAKGWQKLMEIQKNR